MLGTIEAVLGDTHFEANLRQIIKLSISNGVIPVVRTIPYYGGCGNYQYALLLNTTIRKVAAEYKVPLWDLFNSIQGLPNQGMGFFDYDQCGTHLSQDSNNVLNSFRDPYLQNGQQRQNLEALQALYTLATSVMK
jgi:hypothetical protein